MWIMTTGGFLSIVAKGGKGVLMVRARDIESIKTYCHAVDRPVSDVVTGTGTDYPHRLRSTMEEFQIFLMVETEYVQYPNFKNEAKASRGKEYASFLNNVWHASLALEDVPFQKWALPLSGGKELYDWEEKIDPAHLTIKNELGYDSPKKNGGKHRRHKKGKHHARISHR